MTPGSRNPSAAALAPARGPSPRFFAAELAADYATATAAPEDTQEEIVWVAIEIGEHLAERGHAGQWHEIDGEELGHFTLTGDLDDRVSFLRLAAPMLVWLAETQRMDAACVRRILNGIAKGVKKCSRSKKVVQRSIDRLGATAIEENVSCDLPNTVEVEAAAIDGVCLVALQASVPLRCVSADPLAFEATPMLAVDDAEDLPPEAA